MEKGDDMGKFIIEGGKRLCGEVSIGGFKNAAVAILPACILAKGKFKINNLPNISDIRMLCKILSSMGADVEYDGKTAIIDTTNVTECFATYEMAKMLRASYYFLGAGLGRFSHAKVAYPGGCEIGTRPIDQHKKGFEALGAHVTLEHGIIEASAERLVGQEVYMDIVSVGATMNIMLASVRAQGTTVIENAAKEPHIVDLANFLNSMGAKIIGAGTDTIRIRGVENLSGCEYTVIPDQIEAGTFMAMAAATAGDVLVKDVIPIHMEPVSAKLREMGAEVIEYDDSIRVVGKEDMHAVNVKTLVYPGFPTDMQQPFTPLLLKANGTSIVTETIFENRFGHVDELNRMGAGIMVENSTVIINGPQKLSGTSVKASDLRAGACLIIAGLMAHGVTEIEDIYHVERGYDDIAEKIRGIGGKISRIGEEEDDGL